MGGIRRQETVASALVEKYGKPHHIERTNLQNRMGAKFTATSMVWSFRGLHVEFDPVGETLDDGSVTIKSEAAILADKQKQDEGTTARKKL